TFGSRSSAASPGPSAEMSSTPARMPRRLPERSWTPSGGQDAGRGPMTRPEAVSSAAADVRRAVADAHRIVVKVGSSSLTSVAGGQLEPEALNSLVDILAARHLSGRQVVLVSSGAIAAGMGPLGLLRRPRDLATQQAAASVGQGALVA